MAMQYTTNEYSVPFSSLMKNKQNTRFPKIASKPKSLPGENRNSISHSSLDSLTAKAWLYYTPDSQFGYKTNMKRQIASLTKIMTCLCTLELCDKFKMNKSSTYFKVTQWAAKVIGTTANLAGNAWISIEDLLYGLMLPSGNDAATVLAENLGAVIYFDKAGNKTLIEQIRSIDLTEDRQSIKFYMFEFINYMNEKSLKLKMHKTRFSNPHGLDMLNNYSCCDDVLTMSLEGMKNEQFRKIVNTQSYKGTFKFFKDGKVICKPIFWSNTNKLLGKNNIFGVKTGITSKAGGCLSTIFRYQDDNMNKKQGLVIVLGCTSTQDRFRDTVKILNWAEEERI